jgi:hypothetical protein
LPYRSAEFPILFGYGISDREACSDFIEEVTGEIVLKDMPIDELRCMVIKEWFEIEQRFAIKETKYK